MVQLGTDLSVVIRLRALETQEAVSQTTVMHWINLFTVSSIFPQFFTLLRNSWISQLKTAEKFDTKIFPN